jgi:hypothetical protein
MVHKILQVRDLIILISYNIIKFCKQKEMKKYSYEFRYYFPRTSKQDKAVDRVSPRSELVQLLPGTVGQFRSNKRKQLDKINLVDKGNHL